MKHIIFIISSLLVFNVVSAQELKTLPTPLSFHQALFSSQFSCTWSDTPSIPVQCCPYKWHEQSRPQRSRSIPIKSMKRIDYTCVPSLVEVPGTSAWHLYPFDIIGPQSNPSFSAFLGADLTSPRCKSSKFKLYVLTSS